MHLAIEQARIAESCNEVPIGAVLIDPEGNIKQSSHNLVIGNCYLIKEYQNPALKKDYTKNFELD